MKYKVGQLVLNKKLGLGKVLAVSGDLLTVFFKDQDQNPRTINVAVVPMDIPAEQTDPAFGPDDNLDRMKRPSTRRPAAASKKKKSAPNATA